MTAVMQFDDVTKIWPSPGGGALTIFESLSFSINDGEHAAIVGPSGSGKSTMLGLMAGLDKPTSGRVSVCSTPLASLNEDQLPLFRGKYIGIVFQQFHLMQSLTALENVELPLELQRKTERLQDAKDLLAACGLSDRMDHYPGQLSGGECQRVAIARALVTRPKIILADEPTGNLDPKTGDVISNLLFNMASQHKTTLILVTHNLELAARCEKQIAMGRRHT